ncbi:hypothetical protein BDC45DRAFT_512645 [Circinella umbellata]|nr:hypothetical protein BDC45DRAFT_512645 [Circinella umbellata]
MTTATTTPTTHVHCYIEKENNDMLSPPLTPKEDHHTIVDPALCSSSSVTTTTTSNNSNRKGFIHAYAQMVPHLRPMDSRMYGKRSTSSSPTSSTSIDWPTSTDENQQQIFTFDLCKLFAPLRSSKRKRQEYCDQKVQGSPRSSFSSYHDDQEEEEDQAIMTVVADNPQENQIEDEDGQESDFSSYSTVSSFSSHSNNNNTNNNNNNNNSKKKSVSRKKAKTTKSFNNNTNEKYRRRRSNSNHSSNNNGTGMKRNTRELSIKGFTIEPQYLFDNIDIDIQDRDFYPSKDWYPTTDRLDHVPVDINWKGKPLKLDNNDPYFSRLHPIEADVISHMRLSPQLYLRCKRSIIMAAREFSLHGLEFRKSDAQKVCRIDVNKSSRLWAAFNAYGWLKPSPSTVNT